MDAFDADVLIYAAAKDHPLGRRVAALFRAGSAGGDVEQPVGVGSVVLVPEVLGKPLRDKATDEVRALVGLLVRLDLRPFDQATAELAAVMCSAYRMRAADAAHLATAVTVGADRFITNNGRDFPKTIKEIDVVYPSDLPDVS